MATAEVPAIRVLAAVVANVVVASVVVRESFEQPKTTSSKPLTLNPTL